MKADQIKRNGVNKGQFFVDFWCVLSNTLGRVAPRSLAHLLQVSGLRSLKVNNVWSFDQIMSR